MFYEACCRFYLRRTTRAAPVPDPSRRPGNLPVGRRFYPPHTASDRPTGRQRRLQRASALHPDPSRTPGRLEPYRRFYPPRNASDSRIQRCPGFRSSCCCCAPLSEGRCAPHGNQKRKAGEVLPAGKWSMTRQPPSELFGNPPEVCGTPSQRPLLISPDPQRHVLHPEHLTGSLPHVSGSRYRSCHVQNRYVSLSSIYSYRYKIHFIWVPPFKITGAKEPQSHTLHQYSKSKSIRELFTSNRITGW